ncbi:MAG: hypothetical protein KGV58_00555 [Campylobacteraceae bacterium]|nr:hypothetical protein [Campylobacteraceae bacterium]
MYTNLNAKRINSNRSELISFRWALFLVLYQALTPIYIFLTPLIGFMSCYLFFLKSDQERAHDDFSTNMYLAFFYLIFIVLNKGFYLFSGIIFFSLFYRIFVDWIQTSFKCKNCIIVTYVVCGYVGIFGVNNLLAYILNDIFFDFGWEYILYMFLDSMIAMLIFRDRLI